MRDLLIKLQTIDRRWVYLGVALACAIPFFVQIPLNVRPTQETMGVYDWIENNYPYGSGKVVLIDTTWDAGSLGENMGQAEAVMEHLLSKRIPFVVVSIGNALAPPFAESVLKKLTEGPNAKYPGRVYGKDYVILGFAPPNSWQIMQQIAKDTKKQFKVDYRGTSTSDYEKLPIMEHVNNIDDIAMIFCVTYSPDENWIAFIHGVYGTPVAFGCAGIESTTKYRFITSKQLIGLLVSVRGAAEYDVLLHDNATDRTNKGTELIVPLAFGHLVIIAAIVLGNIGYFAAKKRRP